MYLIASGFSSAETTMAGFTAGASSFRGQSNGIRIQRVTAFCGGTTVAANTSGGSTLRVGGSSDDVHSTFVVLPYPKQGDASSLASAVPFSLTLDNLDIRADWFEAATHEAAAGGWGIYIFGE